jgi:hypothetical protein
MLARAHRLDGPGAVQGIRQRQVDGVDGRIIDQAFITGVLGEIAKQRMEFSQFGRIARGNGAQPRLITATQNGRNDLRASDAGATQNAPAYLTTHFNISFRGF